jgi:MFS family permease
MKARRAPDSGNRAAITFCVILATLMQALDTTIANVALPYMQGSVSASQDQIAWVLTSYIVAAAIMTPPTGSSPGGSGSSACSSSPSPALPLPRCSAACRNP